MEVLLQSPTGSWSPAASCPAAPSTATLRRERFLDVQNGVLDSAQHLGRPGAPIQSLVLSRLRTNPPASSTATLRRERLPDLKNGVLDLDQQHRRCPRPSTQSGTFASTQKLLGHPCSSSLKGQAVSRRVLLSTVEACIGATDGNHRLRVIRGGGRESFLGSAWRSPVRFGATQIGAGGGEPPPGDQSSAEKSLVHSQDGRGLLEASQQNVTDHGGGSPSGAGDIGQLALSSGYRATGTEVQLAGSGETPPGSKGLTLLWSSADLSALLVSADTGGNSDPPEEADVAVLWSTASSSDDDKDDEKHVSSADPGGAELERRAEELLLDEFAKASLEHSRQGDKATEREGYREGQASGAERDFVGATEEHSYSSQVPAVEAGSNGRGTGTSTGSWQALLLDPAGRNSGDTDREEGTQPTEGGWKAEEADRNEQEVTLEQDQELLYSGRGEYSGSVSQGGSVGVGGDVEGSFSPGPGGALKGVDPEGASATGASPGSPQSAPPSSFRWAQSLMSNLASQVSNLEKGLQHRQQDMADSRKYVDTIKDQTAGYGQAGRLKQAELLARRMQMQLKDMERTVVAKDDVVNRLLQQTAISEKRLGEVERQAALDREEMRREMQAERSRSRTELEKTMRREEGLRQRLQEAQEGLAERDAFLKQLQEEASLSASALKQAAQAMVAARERTLRIEEQLEMLGDQLVKEKESTAREKRKAAQLSSELTEARMTIEELNARTLDLAAENAAKDRELQERNERLAYSAQQLDFTAEALADADKRIRELEGMVERQKEDLRGEVQVSSKALDAAAQKEKALQEREHKSRQLAMEVLALKAEVEGRDRTMEAVREETAKNAELLMSAAKTRKELADAGKTISQLENQVAALSEQVAEKESFLQDVRADARNSAEALRTAALIKLELNEAREREGQLQDELEAKEAELHQLRMEIEENVRAQRAEMAVQDMVRRATQLESERDALRSGIAKRDQALLLMKSELERGAHMLSAAAETREALRAMKSQMDAMQQAAQNKGRRLLELESEIESVGQDSFNWLKSLPQRKPRSAPIPDGDAFPGPGQQQRH